MSTATRKAFLSIAEAAARIGVSTSTGYNLVRSGELPVVAIHGVHRVPTRALEQWVEQREQQALDSIKGRRSP
jgi:excisionase family DNA binding protein